MEFIRAAGKFAFLSFFPPNFFTGFPFCLGSVEKMAVNLEAGAAPGPVADYREYPLNFNCTDLDVEDLRLYHKRLEQKLASLFLEPSADSQVELWHPDMIGERGKLANPLSAYELTFTSLY
jgi:hypothetical protein